MESVKQRIEQLTENARRTDAYRISINEERELACLHQLVAVTEQVRVLTEQRDAVVAENVALKGNINKLENWPGLEFYSSAWEFHELDGFDASEFIFDIKTPATDAAIADLRAEAKAEGVEMLANGLLTESFRMKAAAALADFDGMEEDRLNQIIWSGQPPEPEGCVWDVEYMTRAWVVMKAIKEFARQLRESKGGNRE